MISRTCIKAMSYGICVLTLIALYKRRLFRIVLVYMLSANRGSGYIVELPCSNRGSTLCATQSRAQQTDGEL